MRKYCRTERNESSCFVVAAPQATTNISHACIHWQWMNVHVGIFQWYCRRRRRLQRQRHGTIHTKLHIPQSTRRCSTNDFSSAVGVFERLSQHALAFCYRPSKQNRLQKTIDIIIVINAYNVRIYISTCNNDEPLRGRERMMKRNEIWWQSMRGCVSCSVSTKPCISVYIICAYVYLLWCCASIACNMRPHARTSGWCEYWIWFSVSTSYVCISSRQPTNNIKCWCQLHYFHIKDNATSWNGTCFMANRYLPIYWKMRL